jgi:hypothetical protein
MFFNGEIRDDIKGLGGLNGDDFKVFGDRKEDFKGFGGDLNGEGGRVGDRDDLKGFGVDCKGEGGRDDDVGESEILVNSNDDNDVDILKVSLLRISDLNSLSSSFASKYDIEYTDLKNTISKYSCV